jgi:hypothetical protein
MLLASFNLDQAEGSAAMGLIIILGFCGGGASALVAPVTGLLVLLKYRQEATGGDYAMTAIGMVGAAILVLLVTGLLVFAFLLIVTGT